jgi:flagellum-specific ATP synthase
VGGGGGIPVSEELLGRVVGGLGEPLDGGKPIHPEKRVSLQGMPFNPLDRAPIGQTLDVGVRAINALFSVARGQRIGLFAPSGVGKSVLLGMMTRYTDADVIVVGLIGERGREVKEFIEESLGVEGRKRAVVVATPADTPPLMRLHGAKVATAIAEYFRDKGLNVLLLMDSLTRYAQAQREIGLTIGEPPATRGFPPSVFALLPALVERAGTGPVGSGTITAFYTVLTDAEDVNDPVGDAARAILDGHIVLSRKLAEQGHFPAIDVEASISRVMSQVVDQDHLIMARVFRKYYSLYERNRDLLSVGAYQAGNDPELDQAIAINPYLQDFLRQDQLEKVGWAATQGQLLAVLQPLIQGAGAA